MKKTPAMLLGLCLAAMPVAAQAGFRVSSHKEVGKSTEFDAASAIDLVGAGRSSGKTVVTVG